MMMRMRKDSQLTIVATLGGVATLMFTVVAILIGFPASTEVSTLNKADVWVTTSGLILAFLIVVTLALILWQFWSAVRSLWTMQRATMEWVNQMNLLIATSATEDQGEGLTGEMLTGYGEGDREKEQEREVEPDSDRQSVSTSARASARSQFTRAYISLFLFIVVIYVFAIGLELGLTLWLGVLGTSFIPDQPYVAVILNYLKDGVIAVNIVLAIVNFAVSGLSVYRAQQSYMRGETSKQGES